MIYYGIKYKFKENTGKHLQETKSNSQSGTTSYYFSNPIVARSAKQFLDNITNTHKHEIVFISEDQTQDRILIKSYDQFVKFMTPTTTPIDENELDF